MIATAAGGRYSRPMDSTSALEALAVGVTAGVPVLLWGSPGTGKTSAVVALGEQGQWLLAGLNVVASNVFCLGAVLAGAALARWI